MTVKARILVVLLGGIGLILVILALQLLAPGDKLEQAGPGNAHVVFSADHNMVIAPGSCVIVHWQVDFIQAVYLGKKAAVGQGVANWCVDEQSMPVLHVKYVDNTTADYPLQIKFLVEQPANWLLACAVVLLLLLSLYVAVSRSAVPAPVGITSGGAARTPRLTSVFSAIGLTLTSTIVMLVLLELGMRFYFTHFGSELERIAYLYSRAEITALNAQTIPLPFVEYGLSPYYDGHNQLGYRGGEIQVPKPAGVYRIVALGGSTTYGTTAPTDQTYPAYLQQTLRNDYGYANVEVVNGGVAGYTSWNIFTDLALRVTELQPDLVIFYEGTNDVLPREVAPDCYSTPSPFLGLDPRRTITTTPEPLSPFALYRFVAIKLGWMQNPATIGGESLASPVSCGGQSGSSDLAHNVEVNRPTYFERNERNMVAVAHANGFPMMFISWAYYHNTPEALPFWRTAVAEHNAISVQVAQDTDSLYFDYAAVAPSEDNSNWSDYVHMTPKGELNMAQAVAQYLVDQKVIPEAPAS